MTPIPPRPTARPSPLHCFSGGMNVDDLTEAINAAERYPTLEAEVAQARALKDRWLRRAEAQVGARMARRGTS